jgi:hypothetical protein
MRMIHAPRMILAGPMRITLCNHDATCRIALFHIAKVVGAPSLFVGSQSALPAVPLHRWHIHPPCNHLHTMHWYWS